MTLLLEHFETLLATPADVEHLNRAILTLAVQGKLVAQDTSDEPALELIKKLSKPQDLELAKLPKNSALLPKNWISDYLGNIAEQITKGATPTTYGFQFEDTGIRFIKVENVKNGHIVHENIKDFISEQAHNAQARSQLQAGDILFSIAGTIGETCVVKQEDIPANTNQALAIIRGTSTIFDPRFLKLQLDSFVANAIKERARGGAMNNVSLGDLKQLLVLIPPLAEQERIVARVETLFAQTRALSAKLARAESDLAGLNRSALAHLLSSDSPEAFNQQWDFISAHFDSLLTRPEHVAPLRQSILELAVRGKLTRREAGDESARELLKRIKAERVESGKKEVLAPVKESEKPFTLPGEWEWAKLGSIADIGTGSTPSRSNPDYYVNGTIPWATSSATNYPFISRTDELITEDAARDTRLRIYPQHTLLVALYGQGKTRGQVSELLIDSTINQACASLVFTGGAENLREYIKLFLLKNYREMRLLAEGGAQPNLNLNKIKQMAVSIPPLAEQARIVARVEQLLGLCEALESRLRAAQEERSRLVVSVLAMSNVEGLAGVEL